MLYYENNFYKLFKGKMQDELKNITADSIDSIVTDPPYELNFMNKGWDNSGIAFQSSTWKKCYEVLKPGGYLLAFGGSRTFHRIACAIEDAGFEIRDTIMWLYGSGFPKSLNVGLVIDKKNGCSDRGHRIAVANRYHPDGTLEPNGESLPKYEGRTKEGKQWQGWGTALKPAYEPIIVARKPIEKSVADNVLKYGVGGINIDECRIPISSEDDYDINNRPISKATGSDDDGHFLDELHNYDAKHGVTSKGRYPSNLILTYDDETFNDVCGGFPDTKSVPESPNANHTFKGNKDAFEWGFKDRVVNASYNDSGNACRYFYSAKASKKDRDEGLDDFEEKNMRLEQNRKIHSPGCEYIENGKLKQNPHLQSSIKRNNHPTVKPTELMQYLIRLVTQKNGIILDPFMGSGSTGKAAMFENRERNANYKFIGIEMTDEYLPIAKARIDYAKNSFEYEKKSDKKNPDIFDFI